MSRNRIGYPKPIKPRVTYYGTGYVFKTGRYKGCTVQEVMSKDISYIEYLNSKDTFELSGIAKKLLLSYKSKEKML